MKLLTEYMAVPEVNIAVIANNSSINNNPIPATKETESSENKNLKLARLVEEEKLKLINSLSQFPVTALWVLNKYEQACDKNDEEESNLSPELVDLLKNIKKHYQAVTQDSSKDQTIDKETKAKRRLRSTVQEFPFSFEDLVKLVDIISYAFKFRGLTYKAEGLSEKKQSEIINKRLNKLSAQVKPSLAEQFKMMDLHHHEEEFLFLSRNQMHDCISEVVLAEHHWLGFRQQLATANSKLVLFIANQYKGNFLDFDDLVQEGHTGLLKAVDRFKYRLGFQFSTYAGYWIRQAISRALSRSERTVRIPCGQIATINRVFRAKEEITLKTGKEPSTKQLAEYTKLSQDEINVILSISQTSIALEGYEDEDDQAFAPIDFLEQRVFKHSYAKIAESQLQNLMNAAVKTLNSREAKILCSHFGIGTDDQKTLQEIGSELNLTRERVRQIQVVALNKIKMRYGEQLSSFL
jgi:RNA polymerase sigma factor (sigma-70 family)